MARITDSTLYINIARCINNQNIKAVFQLYFIKIVLENIDLYVSIKKFVSCTKTSLTIVHFYSIYVFIIAASNNFLKVQNISFVLDNRTSTYHNLLSRAIT